MAIRFCKEVVKPAIKRIRKQLTPVLLREIGEYMSLMGPLVADGNISGQDAEKAVVYDLAAKHDVTKTTVGMGVKLIHETVARGEAEYEEWAAGTAEDPEGEAEIAAFIGN